MHTYSISYKKCTLTLLLSCLLGMVTRADVVYIPMSHDNQTDHLKAYGIVYKALVKGIKGEWYLNFDGGAFGVAYDQSVVLDCKLNSVAYKVLSESEHAAIIRQVADLDQNYDLIQLEKAPKICIYTPSNKQPWDDAVTMALTYADIAYDKVYDDEVLSDKLSDYDWLHLHHEDFTGQYGKFYASYRNAQWYQEEVRTNEAMAAKWGFGKVSELKLAVGIKIKEFLNNGGFLFAMCSATDSYDIAMSADGVDICTPEFDYDPIDPRAQQKIDYEKTLAFKDFTLVTNPYMYEYSDIDNTQYRKVPKSNDYFTLFTFSAKYDPVPTMLCQNHTTTIKGFMGQTTAFKKSLLKSSTLVMGETRIADEARYIHGELGKGTWTFYGGHDPEDYQHRVGDPPTDLALHPNSPGYRLILNNVLFPAAKKKPQKT